MGLLGLAFGLMGAGQVAQSVAANQASKRAQGAASGARQDAANANIAQASQLRAARGGAPGFVFDANGRKISVITGKEWTPADDATGGGFAFLPYYGTDADGNALEPQMFADAARIYGQGQDPSVPEYRGLLKPYGGIVDRSREAMMKLYSGQFQKEEERAMQPLFKAREDAVRMPWLQAVERILGDIKAANARRGYGGDSFATQLTKARILPNAFSALPMVGLQNEQDRTRLRLSALRQPLDVAPALNFAATEAGWQTAPDRAAMAAQAARTGFIKNQFGIGVGQPQQVQDFPGRSVIPSGSQIGLESAGNLLGLAGLRNSAGGPTTSGATTFTPQASTLETPSWVNSGVGYSLPTQTPAYGGSFGYALPDVPAYNPNWWVGG